MGFRHERKKAGLKQIDVAEKIGVSVVAVSGWESGKYTPSATKLPEIAKLYGCKIEDLLRCNPDHEDEDERRN